MRPPHFYFALGPTNSVAKPDYQAPLWLKWWRIFLQCSRPGFSLWVGKIPWRKAIAIHSSVLKWRIPWTEAPGRPQSMGSQKSGHTWLTHTDNKWRECYKRWSCSLVALQSRPDRGVQKPGPLLGKRRLLACDSSHVSLGSFRVFSLPFSICTSICLSWCRSLLWIYHTWSFLISWMCSFFSKFVVFSHNFFKFFFAPFTLLGLLLHLKWCTHWCPTFL